MSPMHRCTPMAPRRPPACLLCTAAHQWRRDAPPRVATQERRRAPRRGWAGRAPACQSGRTLARNSAVHTCRAARALSRDLIPARLRTAQRGRRAPSAARGGASPCWEEPVSPPGAPPAIAVPPQNCAPRPARAPRRRVAARWQHPASPPDPLAPKPAPLRTLDRPENSEPALDPRPPLPPDREQLRVVAPAKWHLRSPTRPRACHAVQLLARGVAAPPGAEPESSTSRGGFVPRGAASRRPSAARAAPGNEAGPGRIARPTGGGPGEASSRARCVARGARACAGRETGREAWQRRVTQSSVLREEWRSMRNRRPSSHCVPPRCPLQPARAGALGAPLPRGRTRRRTRRGAARRACRHSVLRAAAGGRAGRRSHLHRRGGGHRLRVRGPRGRKPRAGVVERRSHAGCAPHASQSHPPHFPDASPAPPRRSRARCSASRAAATPPSRSGPA
jgi:hypothetical protein